MIPPPLALARLMLFYAGKQKNPNPLPMANRFGFSGFGTPNWTRTNGTQFRKLLLYPPELWALMKL